MAINKIFLKPSLRKIAISALLIVPIYFFFVFLLATCMPLRLPTLIPPWVAADNMPTAYGILPCGFVSSLLIFLANIQFSFDLIVLALAYLLSCTIVTLYGT